MRYNSFPVSAGGLTKSTGTGWFIKGLLIVIAIGFLAWLVNKFIFSRDEGEDSPTDENR